jgi:hypothetical protein
VIELREFASPLDDVEALVRSAGGYIRASDDLRPRVLEGARLQASERRVRRRFWQSAAVLLVCGVLTSSILRRSESVLGLDGQSSVWMSPIFAPVDAAARSSDPSWQMVESFTQLRLRQAEMLRL